jgi:hypothetical protein
MKCGVHSNCARVHSSLQRAFKCRVRVKNRCCCCGLPSCKKKHEIRKNFKIQNKRFIFKMNQLFSVQLRQKRNSNPSKNAELNLSSSENSGSFSDLTCQEFQTPIARTSPRSSTTLRNKPNRHLHHLLLLFG